MEWDVGRALKLTAAQERRIDLVDEDLDAVGCFLEFLYTGDYFPRKTATNPRELERDPGTPKVDTSGDQLLKHARVYTLAETLNLPTLKSLASSKIHCVNSTAKGEIAYARYVYAHTAANDTTIRAPVANFWATRSHTLRSEAEDEFRQMCLEFPQFGYDVLSMFLPVLFFVPCVQAWNPANHRYSPRPGRETQARKAGQDAPYAWQLPQAPTRYLDQDLGNNLDAWFWLRARGSGAQIQFKRRYVESFFGLGSARASLHTIVTDGVRRLSFLGKGRWYVDGSSR